MQDMLYITAQEEHVCHTTYDFKKIQDLLYVIAQEGHVRHTIYDFKKTTRRCKICYMSLLKKNMYDKQYITLRRRNEDVIQSFILRKRQEELRCTQI